MSEFAAALTDYLQNLEQLRRADASEASLRDAFFVFLRQTFPDLEINQPLWLEKQVPGLRVRGGVADALYGDLIFEFKRRLDEAYLGEGRDQLFRYLINQERPEQFFGILTDGESLQVYCLHDGRLEKRDELRFNPDHADDAKLWLDCYLFHEKQLVPTAEDVALRFGERSPTFWRSVRILQSSWDELKTDAAVNTKFVEWKSLLSIVYGSQVGDEDLFLRHTYLALFARVLALVALRRQTPKDEEIAKLIKGDAFEQLGLRNFVGDDFFTWLIRDISGSRSVLRALATRLTVSYDLGSINEDLLKELYQELVDPETRHDLGEFYTPDWLAELTLREAGFPEAGGDVTPDALCLLDPACGSGTFLFTAIRLLREAGYRGRKLVDFCSRNLAGIDVHPLAVTIARTNFVLALGPDLQIGGERFHVPVYMADSLSIPEILEEQQNHKDVQPCIRVPVDVSGIKSIKRTPAPPHLATEFVLPTEGITEPERLGDVIDALMDFARPDVQNGDSRHGFEQRLAEIGIPEEVRWAWHQNMTLMRWLLEPPATDTVWQFILKNASRPALLAHRRFAFVVGNPPWLSYRYVQRRDYQERIRDQVVRYGLLERSEDHLFTQIELATLFYAFSAQHYLAEGGTLAFVMPRSILTGAKQHQAFRQRFVATAKLLIDCEQVEPLFNVPSCVVIWEKQGQTSQSEVPCLQLAGIVPTRNAPLAEALKTLGQTRTVWKVPQSRGESPYLSMVRQGATIVPRTLWFVRGERTALVLDRKKPQLETDPRVIAQAKPPWKDIVLQGSMDIEFLFATLLSDDLVPFGWRRLSLVVLPLKDKAVWSFRDAFRHGKSELFKWIEKAEEYWKERAKSGHSVTEYLDWQGKLSAQTPTGVIKLLYNTSGTHLCSCVIPTTEPFKFDYDPHWLMIEGFIADTTTYWLEFRRPVEAHYLCAILNAPCVDQFIKPFQSKGSFGARKGKGERDIHRRPFEVLPIPAYKPGDPVHKRLAQLSRTCHKKTQAWFAEHDEGLLSKRIGSLRQEIRELLRRELAEIDELVQKMLGLPRAES